MWKTLLKSASNTQLAILPLVVPSFLLGRFLGNPLTIVEGWITKRTSSSVATSPPPEGSQLLAYLLVGYLGYRMTHALIPNIQVRMLSLSVIWFCLFD